MDTTLDKKTSLLIIGCGAIGCSLAARLLAKGVAVTMIAHTAAEASLLNEQGLLLRSADGEQRFYTPVLASAAKLPEPPDFCLIATKATELEEAALAILPHLRDDSLVGSLQNGVCGQKLAAIVGNERAVDTVMTWGATLEAPGAVRLTADGELLLGMEAGCGAASLSRLAELLNAAFPTTVKDDFPSHKLSKLLINCCMTSIGALSGQKLGGSLRMAEARRIFLAVIREGMAVAEAMNIRIAPFGGKVDYYRLLARPAFIQDIMVRLVGRKFRDLTSSSLQSLRRGQRTEIDFLNGWLSEQGARLGLATPVNDMIVDMVHQIEAGQRISRPENIIELYERISNTR